MPVTPPTQIFRSVVQSGQFNNSDTGTAAAVITSKVAYAALATGYRRFIPNTTSTTAPADLPAVNAAPTNSGWRMASDILTGERVRITALQSFQCYVAAQQDSGMNLTANFSVIAFLDGVEIGRGTSPSTAMTGTTTIVHEITVNCPDTKTSTTTNPRLHFEVYCRVTGLNGNAISAVNISMVLNTAAGSRAIPPQFAVDYTRTTPDSQASTDTATRTFTGSRTSSEVTNQADTASRTGSFSRFTAEALSTMAETAARQVLYQRLTSNSHAMTEVATRTQVSFRRSTENYTIPTDSAQRTTTASRTTGDTNIQIDTAQKTITYQRVTLYQFQPQDEPPSAQTRHIAGVVRNSDGTPYLGGATVILIREDGIVVQTQTSSVVDGSYDFPRNLLDTHNYTVAAHTFITGAPHQAVTPRALSPV